MTKVSDKIQYLSNSAIFHQPCSEHQAKLANLIGII